MSCKWFIDHFLQSTDTKSVLARCLTNKLLAALLAIAFLFQAVVGAQGLVLCLHADGSQRVENLAAQAECHDSKEESRTASISSDDCVDQDLSSSALTFQTASADSQRVIQAPLPLVVLPWDLLTLTEPKKLPLPRVYDALSPAAEQHALLLSAVVLLI